MTDALHTTLASALKRTVPYLDLLPPTAAADVREALALYDYAVACAQIIQQPKPRVHQNCESCCCVDDGGSDE